MAEVASGEWREKDGSPVLQFFPPETTASSSFFTRHSQLITRNSPLFRATRHYSEPLSPPMCVGIALAWSELPTELIARNGLDRRAHERGGEREVRFFYRDRRPRLPIWRDGRLQIVRWGNGRGQSQFLPATGWTWQTTIEEGYWRNLEAAFVDIPASLGFDHGVWFRIRQGIRGILVPDEHGAAIVYMICEPASHYYQIMTRSTRMPVLIEERI
ncbi:MAG: hypothetical protein WBX00_29805 [Isosphaeraceae bacterium]